MKKLIICSFVGVLVMLLANIPIDARAMDSGMMDGAGYRGYDMGPAMMHDGNYRNYDMGPGMMGQGYENEPQYYQNQKYLDKKDAERIFEDNLNSRHNPNLKLGEIKDQGSSFEADLLTKDNSLVDKLIVDKNTGRMRSAY
jgi:hypothetical protein